jgi:putative flippase GtrA
MPYSADVSTSPLWQRLEQHLPTFLRFLVSGGLGAMVDFGTLLTGTRLFDLPANVAFAISGLAALAVVFLSNKYFTFQRRETQGSTKQAVLFLFVYGTSVTLNYLVSLSFYHFGAPDYLAKAGAIGLLLFFNYACLHKVVFPAIARLHPSRATPA